MDIEPVVEQTEPEPVVAAAKPVEVIELPDGGEEAAAQVEEEAAADYVVEAIRDTRCELSCPHP